MEEPFFIENISEKAFLQYVTSWVYEHTDSSLLATLLFAHILIKLVLYQQQQKKLLFSISFTHLLYRIQQFNLNKNHQERTLGATSADSVSSMTSYQAIAYSFDV